MPPAKYLEFIVKIGVTFIQITVGKYLQAGGSARTDVSRLNKIQEAS